MRALRGIFFKDVAKGAATSVRNAVSVCVHGLVCIELVCAGVDGWVSRGSSHHTRVYIAKTCSLPCRYIVVFTVRGCRPVLG